MIYIFIRHQQITWTRDFIRACGPERTRVFGEYDFGFPEQYVFRDSFAPALDAEPTGQDSSLSSEEVNEVIARCRVLRSFDPQRARRFVWAAEKACLHFIQQRRPQAFVAPRVDTYFLDVMDRVLSRHGIPYIGAWRSAFISNKFFLTRRGEVCQLSEPTQGEVEAFVAKLETEEFRATSIAGKNGLDMKHLISEAVRYRARDAALELIRLTSRYRMGYRELATGFHSDDYRVSLPNLIPSFSAEEECKAALSGDDSRRFFIALQVNPEATIDYYSPDLDYIDIERTIGRLVEVLVPAGYQIIIKDHPNMMGRRDFSFLNRLRKEGRIVLMPYYYSSNYIIDRCRFVFTWSGTVAVQAYMRNKNPVTVCCPYALPIPGFGTIPDFGTLATLPSKLAHWIKEVITPESKRQLGFHILSTLSDGTVFTHDRIPNTAENFLKSLYKAGVLPAAVSTEETLAK